MRNTEAIAQDHASLRRGLDILDRMVQKMEEGERIEIFDIRTIVRFLRVFEGRFTQSEAQELVAAIEASLNPKHGVAFVRSSRQLIQLFRNQLDNEQAEAIATPANTGTQSEPHAEFARLERKYSGKRREHPLELGRSAHA